MDTAAVRATRVVDLRDACAAAFAADAAGAQRVGGLASALAHWSGASLDKSEQCSAWQRRPLTAAQLTYAGFVMYAIPDRIWQLLHMAATTRWVCSGGSGTSTSTELGTGVLLARPQDQLARAPNGPQPEMFLISSAQRLTWRAYMRLIHPWEGCHGIREPSTRWIWHRRLTRVPSPAAPAAKGRQD